MYFFRLTTNLSRYISDIIVKQRFLHREENGTSLKSTLMDLDIVSGSTGKEMKRSTKRNVK